MFLQLLLLPSGGNRSKAVHLGWHRTLSVQSTGHPKQYTTHFDFRRLELSAITIQGDAMSPSTTPQKPNEAVDFERFTATGRPIGTAPSAVVPGYAGALSGPDGMLSGQPILPTRFTDDSIIQVPIRISNLHDPDDQFDEWWSTLKGETTPRKRGFKAALQSLLLRTPAGAKKGQFVLLDMTRADYLRYCAKDERGKYIGTEPQDVSRRVLREMVTRQEEAKPHSTASAPHHLRSTADARAWSATAAALI